MLLDFYVGWGATREHLMCTLNYLYIFVTVKTCGLLQIQANMSITTIEQLTQLPRFSWQIINNSLAFSGFSWTRRYKRHYVSFESWFIMKINSFFLLKVAFYIEIFYFQAFSKFTWKLPLLGRSSINQSIFVVRRGKLSN